MELNKYVEQDIPEFLPKSWVEIPEGQLLIILDGLDEIESKNKNSAIRKIELFSERCAKATIVVSCRSNFYKSEVAGAIGTLNGFSSYILLDLGNEEVQRYVEGKFHKVAEDFYEAVENHRLGNLLRNPFYLIHLTELFETSNRLPVLLSFVPSFSRLSTVPST